MKQPERRNFIKMGLLSSALVPLSSGAKYVYAENREQLVTPKETAGPFYPITPQKDKDFDLTRIEGKTVLATGEAIFVEGSVVNTAGEPIEDVTVELWQANAAGRYAHPHDTNPAPLDPNFQGWAIARSGQQGEFRFKTIMPGAYAVSSSWSRPPHIHYKISKRGYVELTTQMYFQGHPLNQKDLLINRKTESEQRLMIAKKVSGEGGIDTYQYQIVLEKA